jgi:DNA-binding winged helix-turn-helix (wHTH) protein
MIILHTLTGDLVSQNKKLTGHYIIDIVMAYKRKGIRLRKHDIIEYYMTYTQEGYSIAEDVSSINDIDTSRYLTEINRIIERFEYANPKHKQLSMYGRGMTYHEDEDDEEM